MNAPRLSGRKLRQCLALVLPMVATAGLGRAQQAPKGQPASAPHTILLPLKAVAGAPGTLAVLDSQGRLLPNIAVELSGGQKLTTDPTGRALFKAPGQPGTLIAKIAGRGVSASAPIVAPSAVAPEAATSGPPEVRVVSHPTVVAIHDQFNLEGIGFGGAADSNRVFLGDQLCLVLASSPDSLVVLPGPHVPIGAVDLRIRIDGRDVASMPVSVVLLDFSGPSEAANAGSTGQLILHAHGTTERLLVEVRNGSPTVIQLPKGNVQQIMTSGGDENTAPVEVKFVTSGSYQVIAKLVSVEGNSRAEPRN